MPRRSRGSASGDGGVAAVVPPTAAEADRIVTDVKKIPGVAFVAIGANYTQRGLGYNYGISVRLTSKEAEAAYQSHPIHVALRDEVITRRSVS